MATKVDLQLLDRDLDIKGNAAATREITIGQTVANADTLVIDVTNFAWSGSAMAITGTLAISGNVTVGSITSGTWTGTQIAVANGGTGATTAQAAIDTLTAVSGATNEEVLTKDTGTGTAIYKPANSVSNVTEGETARLTRTTAHEAHTLAAASTSDTTTISIPAGARLLAVSFNVNVPVVDSAGDDTWSAAFVTGSTTTLATAAAAAADTKVDLMLPDEISTGVCEIRFTANGGSFSAGVIEIVAYYEVLTSLANV